MPKFEINEEMVRKLAELLDETGLTEIEYSVADHSVRVARGSTTVTATAPAAPAPSPTAAPRQAEAGPRPGAVTAPMPGVIYASEKPENPPFIKVGDTVSEGQTLLLIEAMKTFNQIRAPRAGRIAEILIADKTPVEFGEELVIIE